MSEKPEIVHKWSCWSWGPDHYLCALDEIKRLNRHLDNMNKYEDDDDEEYRPEDLL